MTAKLIIGPCLFVTMTTIISILCLTGQCIVENGCESELDSDWNVEWPDTHSSTNATQQCPGKGATGQWSYSNFNVQLVVASGSQH